jgi:hypothetical protein
MLRGHWCVTSTSGAQNSGLLSGGPPQRGFASSRVHSPKQGAPTKNRTLLIQVAPCFGECARRDLNPRPIDVGSRFWSVVVSWRCPSFGAVFSDKWIQTDRGSHVGE